MTRGKFLSYLGKGQNNAFINCGKNKFQIANLINRSPTIIQNYINNKENYSKNYKGYLGNCFVELKNKNILIIKIN